MFDDVWEGDIWWKAKPDIHEHGVLEGNTFFALFLFAYILKCVLPCGFARRQPPAAAYLTLAAALLRSVAAARFAGGGNLYHGTEEEAGAPWRRQRQRARFAQRWREEARRDTARAGARTGLRALYMHGMAWRDGQQHL